MDKCLLRKIESINLLDVNTDIQLLDTNIQLLEIGICWLLTISLSL